MIDIRIQAGSFDPGRQVERLGELGGVAAVASFTGSLAAAEDVSEILVEHYAALAKSELGAIAAEAEERWQLAGAILIHRHGRMRPGERVVFVAAAAPDPTAAQEACAFLAQAMCERAPFWRKDVLTDGTERWF